MFTSRRIDIDRVDDAVAFFNEFKYPSDKAFLAARGFDEVIGDGAHLFDCIIGRQSANRVGTVKGGENGVA